MNFDMDRWTKVTEGLIDNTYDKQTFQAQFREILRDEDTLDVVLQTTKEM